MPSEPRTFTEKVYQGLRTDIITGALVPGQRLRMSDLCEQYGVSLNVVREALNRLTGEALVKASPQLGFAVTSISIDDLEDLCWTRIQIEPIALRRAIERANITWEAELVGAGHTLAHTPFTTDGEPSPSAEWMAAHSAFHRVLLGGSDSPRLLSVTDTLSNAAELYRRWSIAFDGMQRDLTAEHNAIMQAALDRDVDRAIKLLTEHIETTGRILRAAAQSGDSMQAPPRKA